MRGGLSTAQPSKQGIPSHQSKRPAYGALTGAELCAKPGHLLTPFMW